MQKLEVKSNSNVLVGLDKPDDAGVYKLDSNTALIQTLDFLTPVTDCPYEFGQIAAANSLSDVYAMGGVPITAMNIVCFPKEYEKNILIETLKGGQDKVNQAKAVLIGGHSVDDEEFKYGLSITGIVHPDKVLTNAKACQNDLIILTKPLGTGIISTAIKARIAKEHNIKEVVLSMSTLNKIPSETIKDFEINACTDVTGFGLVGHLLEIAKNSKKQISLFVQKIPMFKNAQEFAQMGMVPAGTYRNLEFCKPYINIDKNIDRSIIDLIFDPQTSGGLLICLNKKDADLCVQKIRDNGAKAWIIAEVGGNSKSGFLNITN